MLAASLADRSSRSRTRGYEWGGAVYRSGMPGRKNEDVIGTASHFPWTHRFDLQVGAQTHAHHCWHHGKLGLPDRFRHAVGLRSDGETATTRRKNPEPL